MSSSRGSNNITSRSNTPRGSSSAPWPHHLYIKEWRRAGPSLGRQHACAAGGRWGGRATSRRPSSSCSRQSATPPSPLPAVSASPRLRGSPTPPPSWPSRPSASPRTQPQHPETQAWCCPPTSPTSRTPRSLSRRSSARVDHHCIWINNSVGHENFKIFLVFVLYALIACFYSMILIAGSFLHSAPKAEQLGSDSSKISIVPGGAGARVAAALHLYLLLFIVSLISSSSISWLGKRTRDH